MSDIVEKNKSAFSTLAPKDNNTWTRDILGVRIDFGIDRAEFINRVKFAVENQLGSYVCTVNPEFIMTAQKDDDYRAVLNASYLNVPDGSGVLMADRYISLIQEKEKNTTSKLTLVEKLFLGIGVGLSSAFNLHKLGDKLQGSDLIYDLCQLAEEKGYTVIFLGGWERGAWGKNLPESGDLAGRTKKEMLRIFPNLKVIYSSSESSHSAEHDIQTIKDIHIAMSEKNVSRIDLVFIASNYRKQEYWLKRNLDKIPASFGIGLGGTFEFVSGVIPRAPIFMTKIHLEWLYRLVQEPWRVKRILTAFPGFPIKIFLASFK